MFLKYRHFSINKQLLLFLINWIRICFYNLGSAGTGSGSIHKIKIFYPVRHLTNFQIKYRKSCEKLQLFVLKL